MNYIAGQLTEEQMRAVAQYYGSLAPPTALFDMTGAEPNEASPAGAADAQ